MIPQLLAHLWGDYILQSQWMAQNKTKRSWPAFVHALLYSLCFAWLCWIPGYVVIHKPICVTYLDKRGNETPCVSEGLNIPDQPAGYRVYGVTPSEDQVVKGYFRWLPWLVIFGTHFLIDRYRLARYVVWAKNLMASREYRYPRLRDSWDDCQQTGYPPSTPAWLSTWLLIIADNTLHLTINFLALKYL